MTTPIEQALTLPCGLVLPNRIVKAAMTESLASPDNMATPELANLYSVWAKGGSGTLITGNVLVDRRYLEAAGNVAIDGEPPKEALTQLSAWAQAGKDNGAVMIMQINHSGRQTPKAICERPVAPSAVALDMPGRSIAPFGHPRALTAEEIEEIIERFVTVVRTAGRAGFDGVQIHGAHGYLISQFLSPKANQRNDQWGGSLENRSRFLLEIIRRSRDAVQPGFAIGVKLNSADFQQGGFTHEDCLAVVDWLNGEAVDFIELSGGNYEQPQMMGADIGKAPISDGRLSASTIAREAYFVEYAKSVSARAKAPVIATGGFRTRTSMNAVLESQMTDLIGLARPLCAEPDLPNKLFSGAEDEGLLVVDDAAIGPTRFLSAQSPFRLIKAMHIFAKQGWYISQMHRLAHGEEPDPNLSLWSALMEMQKIQNKTSKAYLADIAWEG